MRYDIITFGSATQDTFLKLKKNSFKVVDEGGFLSRKALCFPFGSKIFIDELKVFSGGGGTNTAITFSRQGFKVAYMGKVGSDKMGEAVIEELKQAKVSTQLVKKDKEYATAYSVILSSEKERTVLIYRGACHFMQKEEISWFGDRPVGPVPPAKWFYLAPLSGRSSQIFGPLVSFAKKNKIKVAVNLGNTQISLGKQVLRPILAQVDVLILNMEEASLLTQISLAEEKKIIKQLLSLGPKMVVVTKGKSGSLVSDGQQVFEAGIVEVPLVEKTGAGDAFASGFLAGLLKENNIEYAIQFATANATSCLGQVGAKNGLLKRGDWGNIAKVQIKKRAL